MLGRVFIWAGHATRLAFATVSAAHSAVAARKRYLQDGKHKGMGIRNYPVQKQSGIGNQYNPRDYSHSMVPGGFEVTSYTTRLTPCTSLTMRVAIWPSRSSGKR
jgi:hypothetical protein